MYKEIIVDLKNNKFSKIKEFLQKEMVALKTGRASTGLVEDIEVESYGAKQPLKQLASISIPEPRQIAIQPWDKSTMQAIEKAIASNDKLGLTPNVQGDLIRLNLPELNEESRTNLAKIVKSKCEEAKVSIRNEREDAWKEIKKLENDNQINEDDLHKAQEELNEVVNEINKELDDMADKKEKEVMTV
ncbi:MAG: ribosome recycling factor [bacterium]